MESSIFIYAVPFHLLSHFLSWLLSNHFNSVLLRFIMYRLFYNCNFSLTKSCSSDYLKLTLNHFPIIFPSNMLFAQGFFLILFIFNWRIIALQCCVGIHHHESAIGIHMSLPSWTSLLPPTPFTPLGCHRAPDLSCLRHTVNFHWLSNFTYGNVYGSMLLSQSVPLSSSPAPLG